eukprot:GILJ01010559.1.p1 GENE.GILJ01010559.1~~GILJ01010559.1.p1  ORF type:complete len:340 (-),score=72.17 GILJ01010559.1:485-1504(-)
MFKRPQRKQAVVKKWREEVEQNKEEADTDLENVSIPAEELASSSSSEEEQAPEPPPQKPSDPICYSAASFLQSMQFELNLPVIDERVFAVESKLRDAAAALPVDNVESAPEPVVVRSRTRVSQWDERSRIKVIKTDANEQEDSLAASASVDPMRALESEIMPPQILAAPSTVTSFPVQAAAADQMVFSMDVGSSNEEDEAPLVVDLNDVLYQDDKDDPIPKHRAVSVSGASLVPLSTGQKSSLQESSQKRDKKQQKSKKKKKKSGKKSKHKRRRHESDTSSDSSSSSSSSESHRKRRRVKKESAAVADGPTPIERRLLREAELLKKYSLKPVKGPTPSH